MIPRLFIKGAEQGMQKPLSLIIQDFGKIFIYSGVLPDSNRLDIMSN